MLLFSAFLFPILLSAQSKLTNAEMRYFNNKIVDLLEEYEIHIQTPTERASTEFVSLFESKDTKIYNDLLGLSRESDLSAQEYFQLLYQNSQACKVMIKEIEKGNLYEDESHYLIDVTFKKYIQYFDKCGVLFDSYLFYNNDHEINATIAMDKVTGHIYFKKMSGSIDSDASPLPDKYKVFISKDKRDKMVMADNRKIDYNIFDQAIVDDNAKFKYVDSEVLLKVVKESPSCNIYSFNYKPRRWRIKPYVEIPVGEIFKYKGNNSSKFNIETSSIDFGINVGYSVFTKPKFKLSIFSGIGLVSCSANFKYDGKCQYSYKSKGDIDGDTYTRYYEISNLKAKQNNKQLYIPLSLDFDFQFYNKFSLYLQAGAKACYLYKNNFTDIHADIYSYGIYPQYDNLRIDDLPSLGFGYSTIDVTSQDIDTKTITICPYTGLGFRLNIYKSLFLDSNVSYQMWNSVYKNDRVISLYNPVEHNSLISYNNSNGNEVKNFANLFENISLGGIKINIGLLFKF